jgi:CheY-like chemotaxis protein
MAIHTKEMIPMAEHTTSIPHIPVLIVDDDQDIRETIRFMLEDEWYPVLEAADGLEALAVLHTHPAPLIVLTNHTMPHLNGPDLLRRVLDEPALQNGRAYIYLTAGSREQMQDLQEVLGALHAPIVFKPFTVEALLAAVARAEQQLRKALPQEVIEHDGVEVGE